MLRWILTILMFSIALNAYPCDHRKFNIVISQDISFKMILEKLAQECLLSVIYEDRDSQKMLEEKNIILNFYQASLKDILKTGFDALDLNYQFKNNTIRINRLKTQTFFVHYIATSRVASSNTNIIFSQDSRQDGGFNNALSMGNNDDMRQRMIDIANSQDDVSNKSGSKIYSIDALDFWGDIEKELYGVVFHENDKYLPNKDHTPIPC